MSDSQNKCIEYSYSWKAACPGGGGQITNLAISPHDTNLILCSSDMSGAYRSVDGGKSWQFYDSRVLSWFNCGKNMPWAFHPEDPNVIYACTRHGLLRSSDKGESWASMNGPWNLDHAINPEVNCAAPEWVIFNTERQGMACLLFNEYHKTIHPKVLITEDDFKSWRETALLPDGCGAALGIVCYGDNLIVCCENSIFCSCDGGRSWNPMNSGLNFEQNGSIQYFTGAKNEEKTCLYLTFKTRFEDEKFCGGVYRWLENEARWEPVSHKGLHITKVIEQVDEVIEDFEYKYISRTEEFYPEYQRLAVCNEHPEVCYVSMELGNFDDNADPTLPARSTVYRTEDGGDSWKSIYFPHPKMKQYNVEPIWTSSIWGWQCGVSCLYAHPSDPDIVCCTSFVSTTISNDRGKSWQSLHSESLKPNGSTSSGGLVVMTSHNYYFDPHNLDNRYIAMTDFPGWRSLDAGNTWFVDDTGNLWPHNVYAMAFDPDKSGRIWAAATKRHDIPHWRFISCNLDNFMYRGGVIFSDDSGKTWRGVGRDLPCMAATDITLDPESSKDARRLWVAILGSGVYMSENGGETWQSKNNGLTLKNPNVFKIKLGPDRRLYSIVTAGCDITLVPGGLFVSDDFGDSWHRLTSERDMPYPVDVLVNSQNFNVMYVSCFTSPVGGALGGIWKTCDGGLSWSKVMNKDTQSVLLHPENHNIVYACTAEEGLYVSYNGGKEWNRGDGPPYARLSGAKFNPENSSELIVTTFGGGVWQGIQKEFCNEK